MRSTCSLRNDDLRYKAPRAFASTVWCRKSNEFITYFTVQCSNDSIMTLFQHLTKVGLGLLDDWETVDLFMNWDCFLTDLTVLVYGNAEQRCDS